MPEPERRGQPEEPARQGRQQRVLEAGGEVGVVGVPGHRRVPELVFAKSHFLFLDFTNKTNLLAIPYQLNERRSSP